MDIKKIFNKKKSKSKTSGKPDGGNSDSNSGKSMTSTISSTNLSAKSTNNSNSITNNTNNINNINEHAHIASSHIQSTSQSFQYSYNSNSNSLFSSNRTMSTGLSSKPSTNISGYSKSNKEQTKITSIGRPLRVLNEEEDQEDDSFINKKDEKPIINDEYSIITNTYKSNLNLSKKNNNQDDISISPTEKSAGSIQGSSNSIIIDNKSLSTVNISENEFRNQLNEFIRGQLRNLSNSIDNVLMQISQSVLNLTKASIAISENINLTFKTIKNNKYISLLLNNQFDTNNSIGLRRIIKSILHLFDNLLIGDVYNKSKASVIKSLHDLFLLIKILPNRVHELTNFISYMKPSLFAIDSNVINIEKINNIMENLLLKSKNNLFSDQNGSFIAPVLRGFFSPSLSIITFVFGFPEISKEHYDVIKHFSMKSNDMHYLLQKNSIKIASSRNNHNNISTTTNNNRTIKLKSPFRTIDENQGYIPISMSISTDSSLMSSGTLGGYIYPKVPEECRNPKLLKYRGQIFGITCAHVVLANENNNNNNNNNSSSHDDEENINHHPKVSIPSPVLINLYKNALINEMNNHSIKSLEYKVYNEAVQMIDKEYPMKRVSINGKKVNRNLPIDELGSIIWGERLINDNKLSDLAIIKINEKLKKKFVNYLGEDLQLSQYDPSLILSNLNVKRTISLQPRKNGILNNANLNVFKVGSTSGFTNGKLNGIKMIYWSDGSLRSSEFIISSTNGKTEGFANGGDSGAWVLTKLIDVNNIKSNFIDDFDEDDLKNEEEENKSSLSAFIESFIPSVNTTKKSNLRKNNKNKINKGNGNNNDKQDNEESGLGLLGMLHSYDGEYKQFGLFTPIDDILDRLNIVTGVEWGVVGCSEDTENDIDGYGGEGNLTEGGVDVDNGSSSSSHSTSTSISSGGQN